MSPDFRKIRLQFNRTNIPADSDRSENLVQLIIKRFKKFLCNSETFSSKQKIIIVTGMTVESVLLPVQAGQNHKLKEHRPLQAESGTAGGRSVSRVQSRGSGSVGGRQMSFCEPLNIFRTDEV